MQSTVNLFFEFSSLQYIPRPRDFYRHLGELTYVFMHGFFLLLDLTLYRYYNGLQLLKNEPE